MTKDSKIAVWNNYHNMPEILCIEDGDGWKEVTVGELVELIRSVINVEDRKGGLIG